MKHPMAHKIIIPRAYVPSEATDIRKTFARVKREQAEAQACKSVLKSKPYPPPSALSPESVVLTWPRIKS